MQFQDDIISKLEHQLGVITHKEMRGSLKVGGNTIYYCVDAIHGDTAYEAKSIQDPNGIFPDWYLEQSILQVAFYKSMMMLNPSNTLVTASFRIADGYPEERINYSDKMRYKLLFGPDLRYDIKVNDPQTIIQLYSRKAEATSSYDAARAFDAKYKHTEFKLLSEYFEYTLIR